MPLVTQTNPRACGAACLEMVLAYYGRLADQQQIMQAIDRGEKGGVAAEDMKAYAEQQGVKAFFFHGTTEDLFRYLDRRMPVIVARRARFPSGLGNHYMVLTGRSDDREYLTMNDPAKGRVRVRLEAFLADWTEAQRFLMIIAPPAEPERSRAPGARPVGP